MIFLTLRIIGKLANTDLRYALIRDRLRTGQGIFLDVPVIIHARHYISHLGSASVPFGRRYRQSGSFTSPPRVARLKATHKGLAGRRSTNISCPSMTRRACDSWSSWQIRGEYTYAIDHIVVLSRLRTSEASCRRASLSRFGIWAIFTPSRVSYRLPTSSPAMTAKRSWLVVWLKLSDRFEAVKRKSIEVMRAWRDVNEIDFIDERYRLKRYLENRTHHPSNGEVSLKVIGKFRRLTILPSPTLQLISSINDSSLPQ